MLLVRLYSGRPADDKWNACPRFVSTVFPTTVDPHRSMPVEKFVSLVLIAVVDNRTVIAGKDQDGVVCDVEAVQCVHDFTDGPVQLQDDVATSAEPAFACETWVGDAWYMYVLRTHI